MARPTLHHIKKSQRESLLMRTIAKLFQQASIDDPQLNSVFISRVDLSTDKGCCNVYFYSAEGAEHFNELLQSTLKLYKPSMRKALATDLQGRYTPELVFRFDDQFEKTMHMEKLFEKIKVEDQENLDSISSHEDEQ